MILFAFDLETTGLDFQKDCPIEVGAILYSTGQQKCLESQGFLVKTDVPILPEITKLTGITQAAIDKFGIGSYLGLEIVLGMMNKADAVIGHNAKRFDKRMLESWSVRENLQNDLRSDILWIDTYTDLPGADPTKLSYMAADAGFVNMFPHSALADCQTCLKLVQGFDIDKVIQRAESPTVVVQAHQNRNDNDLAKKARFRWYPDRKIWWRFLKEIDLDSFSKNLLFDISVHRENIEEFQNL